jgi:hypothetical protein
VPLGVKLRLSEGYVQQAIALRNPRTFDFFKKPFVLMRDGCAKSDANKLRLAN